MLACPLACTSSAAHNYARHGGAHHRPAAPSRHRPADLRATVATAERVVGTGALTLAAGFTGAGATAAASPECSCCCSGRPTPFAPGFRFPRWPLAEASGHPVAIVVGYTAGDHSGDINESGSKRSGNLHRLDLEAKCFQSPGQRTHFRKFL